MSFIKISNSNLTHNLNLIKSHTKDADKIAVVLKDNAYGHGILEIAKLSSKFGVKKAVVRDVKEALEIAEFFEEIVVLGGNKGGEILPKNTSFALNMADELMGIKSGSKIDIKVDTGMHRNGVFLDELNLVLKQVLKNGIEINSIFTHFRGGDDLSSELFWQKKNFEQAKKIAKNFCLKNGVKLPKFHSLNSSSLFRTKEVEDDFVRVGIAIYGYLESDDIFKAPSLKPIMSLYGDKISTKFLKKGSKIGYGGSYTLDKDSFVSTYDIGYGDGFMRLNEKIPYFTPEHKRVLGRVSMDYLSIEGDSENVCIFDDAKKLARIFDTISYDILVKLSKDIRRVVE